MGKLDECGSCAAEWGSYLGDKRVEALHVPISESGATFMAVCQFCARKLSPKAIAAIAEKKLAAAGLTLPKEEGPLCLAPVSSEARMVLARWVEKQERVGV